MTTSDPIAKLLPCPFCGLSNEKVRIVTAVFVTGVNEAYAACENCGAFMRQRHGGRQEAIALAVQHWNTRAAPPAPANELEAYANERNKENQDALRKLSKVLGNPCVMSNISLADGLVEYAIKRLSAMPAPEVGWIACETRMPDSMRFVLAHFPRSTTSTVKVVLYDGQQGWKRWEDERELSYPRTAVNHWMPLPAPPAIEKDKT